MRAPQMISASVLGGALIIGVLIAACAVVPLTGRTQLNLVSDQQLTGSANQQFAQFMRLANDRNAVLAASESPQAASTVEFVNRVSARIVDAAGLRGQRQWETVVVKSRQANAFVMPNGKIVVFTGILSVTKNEAALGAVLGHEVGHVVGRHAAERMSQALLVQLGATSVDAALAVGNSAKYRPVVGAALGLGAQYGILLPFSRAHESEADHLGLYYMAKAGYDPEEAIGLWERMEAQGGKGPWEFLSTHPSPETRRAQIREWLPNARLYYVDRSRPLPTNLAHVDQARSDLSQRAALAPVASRPSLSPGFSYRVQPSNKPTPTAFRVERVEPCQSGECYVVSDESGNMGTYTTDFNLVEVKRADGSWFRYTPPLPSVRWPMRVGDSWSDTVTLEQSSRPAQTLAVKGEVVAYESVSVPAGQFLAFKILVSVGGRPLREAWWAPETKTSVKTVTYDTRGNKVTSELLEYRNAEEGPAR